MKRMLLGLTACFYIILATGAWAQLPLTTGLNYLATSQSPDGSWGNDATGTEILPSTIAAIEALKALNHTNTQSYTNALIWLQSQGLQTTDYFSERIHALMVSGADGDLLLSYLDELIGAWGGYNDYDVNNLDTALALQALKAINYQDQNTISYALGYLQSTQNADGGWGFYQGDDSNAYMTAIVLQTLSQFKTTYDLQAPISSAAAYLLTKQNPDGGFGSSPSTVYETALSMLALIESGQGQANPLQNAVTYHTSTQLANGSWNDDPYSTALALRALANVKPNLTVSSSDITFSNPAPTRGEIVIVTATIHNSGSAPVANVIVQFFDGEPSTEGVQVGTDQTIQAIDAYSSTVVSVAFSTSGLIGRHALFVQLDPADTVDEATKSDNRAAKFITINTLPDLYVNSAEIIYSPVNPTPDVPLNITFIIRNLGEQGLQNVLTRLYASPPDAGGVAIDSFTIKSIGGKGAYGVNVTIYSPTPGVNTFYLKADPDDDNHEANESNNVGSATIVVGFPKDNDLSIYPSNISFARPPGAKPGDSFTINAVIGNTGSANILTDVAFYSGDPASGGSLIGRRTITVPAIGNQLAQMTWTIPPDSTIIYAVVDPDNLIPETDKANNIAYRGLTPTLPDLVIHDADMSYTPSNPTPRSEITISAIIRNHGDVKVVGPQLYLYDGTPESGGRLLGSFAYINAIEPISYERTTITLLRSNYSFSAGEHTFYVVADPNNVIDEVSEGNNRAKMKLTITNDPKTDLYISQDDITFSPPLPLAGQQVSVTANIHNSSSEVVSSAYVAFYNGDPLEGGALIGRVSTWFPQESSKTVSTSFTMTAGVPKIFVVVDDNNRIQETNENNNVAWRSADTYKVDLSVSPGDISLRPVLPAAGATETVEVTVHSAGITHTSATLKLYEGKPESGRLIGSQSLLTNGSQKVTVAFPSVYTYPGDGATLSAVIDDTTPVEDNLANNQATAIFGEHIDDGASNEGTDFWLVFPDTYYWTAKIVVQSKHQANVIVKAPNNFLWGGSVSPGFPAVIPLTGGINDYKVASDGVVENRGIHVSSDRDVSVVFHVPLDPAVADDSYLGLPTNILGTEYYFLSYTAWGQHYPSLYVVIATEDNTNVSINGTVINMNKGQTYQVKRDAVDHSGTHIKSDRPIALIGGSKCSNVTTTPFVRACDSLLEQMLPVSLLGTDYYTAPLYSPVSSEVFRILAVQDNTGITVKDKYVTKTLSLNKGQWAEYENNDATHITSTGPVMVAQFSKGYDAAKLGDPSQITIIPTDKLKTEHRFYNHEGYEQGDFFSVVAPEPGTTVMLDGAVLDTGWTPLPDKGSYLVMPVNVGEHVITADKPVAVYAHGYREWGSYGYPTGVALSASNLVVSNLTSNPPSPSDGQLVEITATLSNEGNKWAKDVIVRAYNGDPAEGGIQIGGDVFFDILYPKESKTVAFTWDARGYGGINNIYVVADPLNTAKESNEMDNSAMIIVEVLAPLKPDLTVAASDITLSQELVNEGATVTLTVKIKNRGADAGDIPVSLYLGDPASGGSLLESALIRPIVPQSGEAVLTFTLNTLGYPEMSYLFVVVDPQNGIDELVETNNKASILLRVNRKKLSLEVITDGTQYQAQSPVGIDVYVKNQSISPWSGTGDVYVEDTASHIIAHVASFTVDDLKPMGVENWGYRAPITVTKASEMRDAIAIAYVNFNSLLSSMALTGKTIDLSSVRVLEFDSSGSVAGEKKARFVKANGFDPVTNPSGRLLWLLDGVTRANTPRYFHLYFDTLENGPKQPSLNTALPEKGRLIAFTGYWGDIYTVTSNGDGTFGSKTIAATLSSSLLNGVGLSDLNNDGFPDLISGDEYRDIYYLQNKADGSDTFLPKLKIGNIGLGTMFQAVTSADYNTDGNLDFVVSMYHSTPAETSNLYVFLGNGNGTFTMTAIPLSAGTSIRGKASADFDKDGNMDLVVGDGHGSILIYFGNGDGTFRPSVEIGSIGKDIYGLAAGDFDGDGFIDIVVNGGPNDGIAYIIGGMAGGEFKPVVLLPSLNAKGRTAYDVVDINVDGKLDVLAAQYTAGELVYFEGNGDGTFKTPVLVAKHTYYLPAVSASRNNPEVIATLGAPENIEGRLYQFIWNTGATLPASYRIHVTLSAGTTRVAEKSTPFEIVSDKKIDSRIVIDKISYKPNETAAITSSVTSLSANAILENLTARIVIVNSLGTVLLTESMAVPMLVPGQLTELKTYWNTSTNHPGAYPVTLEIRDAAGLLLSTSTTTLTISSEIKPSALLRGQISVDKQSVLQGEPVNITYQVTNIGNLDLSQVNLNIKTVHIVQLSVYDTLTDQTSLLKGAAYANTQQLNTDNYSAKDYLVVLMANISGTEESLASTYFRVEGAPSAPSLNAPAHASDVETATPALSVNNASDPNDDSLVYEFELYSDNNLTTRIASSGMTEEVTATTSWQVPTTLQENAWYYWRARAFDGRLYGEWMPQAAFRVNVTNEAPGAPSLSSPSEGAWVDTVLPLLAVNNAADPDSINLTYNFMAALDPALATVVASQIGVFEGPGTTSWQVNVPLQENTWYYWTAQADDWQIIGPWMPTASFFVNTANDAPSAPVIIAPAAGAAVTSTDVLITALNSTDPDSSALTYAFEADTTPSFDSPNRLMSGSLPQGSGNTSWLAAGLRDNTWYYTRAKASDGQAESPWSPAIAFFVNTQNDAPTAPVLANPSNGAGVNSFTPALSVHNATDLDNDVLTYEFEIYADAALTGLVGSVSGIQETALITSWIVPVSLAENSTYYWRARAFDGQLYGPWMQIASFMVNTANDAPTAPTLNSPAMGSSLSTLTPVLAINNAADPDSDVLTYDFEIYAGGLLVKSAAGIPQDALGITSYTITTPLSDNTTYQWRARAYDNDRYGAWMDMATFSIHLPSQNITSTIDFDPNTLNQKSKGNWVTVYIELPAGYNVANINISSLRLNGTIPAETWPYAIGDYDHDGIPDLMVKFNRDSVINLLPSGDNIRVTVTGTVGTTTFDGVDTIRVIH